jgi:hypothetical protein
MTDDEIQKAAEGIELEPGPPLYRCMNIYRSSRGADGRGALRWIVKGFLALRARLPDRFPAYLPPQAIGAERKACPVRCGLCCEPPGSTCSKFSPTGCTLPVEERPSICNTYLCPAAERVIDLERQLNGVVCPPDQCSDLVHIVKESERVREERDRALDRLAEAQDTVLAQAEELEVLRPVFGEGGSKDWGKPGSTLDDPFKGWREYVDTVRLSLRNLCRDFGDNDWDDDLHLADVVEKHLGRHLYDGESVQ